MELEGLWIGLLDRHIEEEGVCEGRGHWLRQQVHVREEGTHHIYASQPWKAEQMKSCDIEIVKSTPLGFRTRRVSFM